MEFDLIKFTLSPTLEEFDRCRKKDLIVIAEFFNVLISKEQRKHLIKDELYGKLVEMGILPERMVAGGPELETDGEAASDGADSVSDRKSTQFVDPEVTIRLKELDLALKKTRARYAITPIKRT